MMGDDTNGGPRRPVGRLAAAVVAAIVVGPAAAAQEGRRAADYPEVAVTDYVMGCVAANGRAEEVLERCTCSIDVIGGLLPYEAYEEAETYLSLGLVAGERGALFRTSEGSQAAVDRLRRAQIEAELRCF